MSAAKQLPPLPEWARGYYADDAHGEKLARQRHAEPHTTPEEQAVAQQMRARAIELGVVFPAPNDPEYATKNVRAWRDAYARARARRDDAS